MRLIQAVDAEIQSKLKKLLFILMLIIHTQATVAKDEVHKQVVNVAAIDWCPQICPKGNPPGYIIDLVKEVFDGSNYELNVKYYPWSRAIQLTRYGAVHALLSPAKAEAPDLKYPLEEVGVQRMCFFTRNDSDWVYKDTDSLKGLQVGVATDTSLEELNDYMQANPHQFQFQPYLNRYIRQSVGKLERKRIDTFLFTYATTMHEFRQMGVADKYRAAGCVNTTNIYMAFTAANIGLDVQALMDFFDSRMRELHKSGAVEPVMKEYQLTSWR